MVTRRSAMATKVSDRLGGGDIGAESAWSFALELATLAGTVLSFTLLGKSLGPAGYGAYAALRRVNRTAAVFVGVALADLATYVVTSVQLGLAFPDAVSGFAGGIAKFLGVFAITQIPLAIAEGLLGVLVMRLLAGVARPELERLGVLTPEGAAR